MPTSLTDLLNKYSKPGSRYTYYPPHSLWDNKLNYFKWLDIVKESYHPEQGIDLYLHIPFCESLCTFCGCNIRVTKSYQDVLPYINSLKKEWSFYQKLLGSQIKINSLYLGGGSPNFLRAEDLDHLLNYFTSKDTLISIELDPRFVNEAQLMVLKKHNVHTLSFGVQDLDLKVLKNVNREQSFSDLLHILTQARTLDFPNINIDLIYGLTHQSSQSLQKTFKQLNPLPIDSIALYPFAKVPWQNNTQKIFGDFKDFTSEEMHELFYISNNELLEMGFTHIGMGHFLKNTSPYLVPFETNKLKRNIMGYTARKSNLLIGLGVSSISNSDKGHVQNEKILENYMQSIAKERMALIKSHSITEREIELAKIFEKIISFNFFTQEDVKSILPDQKIFFEHYLENNFIISNDEIYTVTKLGRYFLKSLCQLWG